MLGIGSREPGIALDCWDSIAFSCTHLIIVNVFLVKVIAVGLFRNFPMMRWRNVCIIPEQIAIQTPFSFVFVENYLLVYFQLELGLNCV